MLQDARIVMLDEPDANLDHDGVVLVRQRIEEMIAAGKMVAVAAHTPEVAGVPGTRVELVTR